MIQGPLEHEEVISNLPTKGATQKEYSKGRGANYGHAMS